MRKAIVSFVVAWTLIACSGPSVKLPDSDISVLDKVEDYSVIYFFKSQDTETIEVNDKNRIGTTNWVFHVDENLTMKEVVPELIRFQEKRKNATHNKENAEHYFSYRDLSKNILAFVPFTELNFTFNSYFSSLYVREHTDFHLDYHLIRVNILNENDVSVDGYAFQTDEALSYIDEIVEMKTDEKPSLVYLNVHQEVRFGRYFQVWMKLFSRKSMTLSPIHFVYDPQLIEGCECH